MQNCYLCSPTQSTFKASGIVIMKLTKILRRRPKLNKQEIGIFKEQSFFQLIQYLSSDYEEIHHIQKNCSHKQLKQYLMKKIGITIDELYALCQYEFTALTKRKYELELIEKIGKIAHSRFSKNPQPQPTLAKIVSKTSVLTSKSQNLKNSSSQNEQKEFSSTNSHQGKQLYQTSPDISEEQKQIMPSENVKIQENNVCEFPLFNHNGQNMPYYLMNNQMYNPNEMNYFMPYAPIYY